MQTPLPVASFDEISDPLIERFFDALKQIGFKGETYDSYSMRVINATDNSIYQILPRAIVIPREVSDLDLIFNIGNRDEFKEIQFMPRGGGTGTDGQSLNNAVTIDASKYLTEILEINIQECYVRVEPGVVLSVLQKALAPYGYFFPAHVSPANRATMGGMVSTDACGKGSAVYGRTGHYLQSADVILADGRSMTITPDMRNEFEDSVEGILKKNRDIIDRASPDVPRRFTGYNLSDSYDPETGKTNLLRLIAGSEGSLVMLKELKLGIVPIPKYKSLFAVSYTDFMTALEDAREIIEFKPAAIETIDNHVLQLAGENVMWHDLARIIPDDMDPKNVMGLHFVEFVGNDEREIQAAQDAFKARLDKKNMKYFFTEDAAEMAAMWQLRNQCAGLLGNVEGPRRPWPFIEDAAVPPAKLPEFVRDVKAFLNGLDLDCGMFGHVDAGCLHMRPILDLRDEKDAALIRVITESMVETVAKYGGVLWGEHGRGIRGEFITDVMGAEFYDVMRRIKALFDPENKMNPGKLATAAGSDLELTKIDGAPFRGDFDRQIDEKFISLFPKSIECNGNGTCFSVMPDETMCPSYKVTGDRRQSPKGRAGLLREYLRLVSISENEKPQKNDFAHDVYTAMAGCLGCKACTSTCPVHVNIPDMKSRFLEFYHQKYRRPLRDYIFAYTEKIAAFSARVPRLSNGMQNNVLSRRLLRIFLQIEDPPHLSVPNLKSSLKGRDFQYADLEKLQKLTPEERRKYVVVMQDAFTSFYDAPTVIAAMSVIKKCGREPLLLPFRDSGKGLHVKGFLTQFVKTVNGNMREYKNWTDLGLPIIGIDPSVTLVYRDEYRKFSQNRTGLNIELLQDWLLPVLNSVSIQVKAEKPIKILPHCTEHTACPQSALRWQEIFEKIGLTAETVRTGCCGMAGGYGHESEHISYSQNLYDLGWLPQENEDHFLCATGYSCRMQAKRFGKMPFTHPIMLLDHLLP